MLNVQYHFHRKRFLKIKMTKLPVGANVFSYTFCLFPLFLVTWRHIFSVVQKTFCGLFFSFILGFSEKNNTF